MLRLLHLLLRKVHLRTEPGFWLVMSSLSLAQCHKRIIKNNNQRRNEIIFALHQKFHSVDRSKWPEPVGPMRSMLLFSSSTESSSITSPLPLPSSPAGLTHNIVKKMLKQLKNAANFSGDTFSFFSETHCPLPSEDFQSPKTETLGQVTRNCYNMENGKRATKMH